MATVAGRPAGQGRCDCLSGTSGRLANRDSHGRALILAAGAGPQLAERHDVESDRHRNGHGGNEGQGQEGEELGGRLDREAQPEQDIQGRGIDPGQQDPTR